MRRFVAHVVLGLVVLVVPSMVVRAELVPWIAVVMPEAGADRLDGRMLSLIYRRKQIYTPEGERWLPVNLPVDHPLRRRFSRAVLGISPELLDDYWNEQYFQGVLPPHVLGSEQAVLRFVASTPHAIGYVSACHDGGQRLRTVLVIDPEGIVRAPDEAPACPPG